MTITPREALDRIARTVAASLMELGEECDQCQGSGWLENQSYGYVDMPDGWVPIQACDACDVFADDQGAAEAYAVSWDCIPLNDTRNTYAIYRKPACQCAPPNGMGGFHDDDCPWGEDNEVPGDWFVWAGDGPPDWPDDLPAPTGSPLVRPNPTYRLPGRHVGGWLYLDGPEADTYSVHVSLFWALHIVGYWLTMTRREHQEQPLDSGGIAGSDRQPIG